MLDHKHSSRTKAWLADLCTKRILNRTYSKAFGENTKPATYYLGTKSRRLLRGQEGINLTLLNRIYKEKQRSQTFRETCIFIANIYLNLESLTQKAKGILHFYTKTELESYDYLPEPLPDAYIVVKQGKTTARYFLEIISDQLPRFVLRNRIEDLFEYCNEETWQDNSNHPFPIVLMVCPNYVIRGFLSKFIGETLESDGSDISFYLTTRNEIEVRGMKPDIWQKAI